MIAAVQRLSFFRGDCPHHGRAKFRAVIDSAAPPECCACIADAQKPPAPSPDEAAREAVAEAVQAKLRNDHSPASCDVCAANMPEPEAGRCARYRKGFRDIWVYVAPELRDDHLHDLVDAHASCAACHTKSTPGMVPAQAVPAAAEPALINGGGGDDVSIAQPLGVTPNQALADAATEAARALARLAGAIGRGDTAAASREALRASLELATVATRMGASE